jgi:hypothetical protein
MLIVSLKVNTETRQSAINNGRIFSAAVVRKHTQGLN